MSGLYKPVSQSTRHFDFLQFKPSDIIQKGRMHWEKAPPPGQARSRPYQGVRVRDPVKELLRRKRSLEPAPPPQVRTTRRCEAPNITGSRVHAESISFLATQSHAGAFCWTRSRVTPRRGTREARSPPGRRVTGVRSRAPGGGPRHGAPRSTARFKRRRRLRARTRRSPGTAADVYVQTLCPSYAMLTYTHAPLLANFGTVPVAPAPGSAPQMELPDSGLPTCPGPARHHHIRHAEPGGPTGSPLVHVPLSMSLTTVIPQLEEVHHMDPDLEQHAGAEAPSLLDKLLEDQEGDGEEEDKDSYGHSLFLPPN
ncbi:POU domain class 2-associating factor 1 [Gasterosteus aculeatus]